MTVSGLTITRAWRQPGHRQDRMTQKTLSAFRSNGRGLFRFRTATCCRRARISVWSAARSAKISMILCMPERVSGGDAKFQGFCDGWNKWEGQPAVAGQGFLCGAPRGSAKISMILCMPERVSGGDAKFQGFCDGWNKWEGQDGRDLMILAAGAAIPPVAEEGFTYCYNLLEFKWDEATDGLSVRVRPREWADSLKRFACGSGDVDGNGSGYLLACPNFRNAPRAEVG